MAGPTMRALLKVMEFSAMALGRSSLPTISTANACRAGPSKALTTPMQAARTTMCHTSTTSVKVRPARTKASVMAMDWVTTSKLRLDTWSTTTPAHGETMSTGIADANPTTPRASSEPLIW